MITPPYTYTPQNRRASVVFIRFSFPPLSFPTSPTVPSSERRVPVTTRCCAERARRRCQPLLSRRAQAVHTCRAAVRFSFPGRDDAPLRGLSPRACLALLPTTASTTTTDAPPPPHNGHDSLAALSITDHGPQRPGLPVPLRSLFVTIPSWRGH